MSQNQATNKCMTTPLKWWGGKSYLAKGIINLMPRHLHYVEPYFGGGAVLLARDPFDESKFWGTASYERGVSEVVNDIDGRLMNLWRVLQNPESFAAFQRAVQAMPFSETAWKEAEDRMQPNGSVDVDAAVAFFIRCRQSRTGGFKDFATLSQSRTRRYMNEQASAWLSTVEALPAVHARLKRVVILNQDALDVIRKQDGEKTLFYLDPPYIHAARASTDNYRYEMTESDHRNLLATIKQCKGMVMLSGYPNDLYDRKLHGWTRNVIKIDNKAAGGQTKREMSEILWMSPNCKHQQSHNA